MIRVQVLSEEKSNDGRVVLDKSHEVPEKKLSTLDNPPSLTQSDTAGICDRVKY